MADGAADRAAVRLAGAPTERLAALPCPSFRAVVPDVLSSLPFAGRALWPDADGPWAAIADGNRAVVLPAPTVEWAGRAMHLSVKGVGARAAMYGDGLFGGGGPRTLWSESWFGEAPFGAQGASNAAVAVALTERAEALGGFGLCPVIAVAELPESLVRDARERFWYRRHEGAFVQEWRLVPSDVRLFHATSLALGRDPDAVLERFGVADVDAFLDRLIASGIAALTLFVRSLREEADGLRGLDYRGVWLDKDSVVAPDGALFFADLEGLEAVRPGADRSFEQIVTTQLEHGRYELLYAVDAVVRAWERRTGRRPTDAERRRMVAMRCELALQGDPFVRPERSGGALDLRIGSPHVDESVRLRWIDR